MSVLPRPAHFQNRRDEIPNQELARDLVARGDLAGIRDVAENLWNADAGIQKDCVKVLAEFIKRLEKRLADLTGAQAARVKNVIRTVEKR